MSSGSEKLPALFYAKDGKEVRRLITVGASIHERSARSGHSSLHLNRSASAVRELIQLGADVSARSKWKETPLHKQQDRSLIVAALIRAGADVDARDEEGDTPLHCSLSPAVTFRLLKAGASPEKKNRQGQLPEECYGTGASARVMIRLVREARKHGKISGRSWKKYEKRG